MKNSIKTENSALIARHAVLYFVLCASIFARALPSWAEQIEKSYRIGFMSIRSETGPWDEAFKVGLRDFGYIEGKNVFLIYHWADGKFDRFPALAENLVRQNVDIIVTETTPAAQAAKQATQNIPIVMAIGGDAVGAGLVTSLARPGGNITGQTFIGTDLAPKWLEKLNELAPKMSHPAFLANSSIAPEIAFFKVMEPVARDLGMTIKFVDITGFKHFRDAFREMRRSRHDGFIGAPNGGFRENRKEIASLAAEYRLPALYGSSEFVEAGGLASYGQDVSAMFRRTAYYVDRILSGTKPADLPVERPSKYEFWVSLKAAKQIGLTIPPNVLARADKVIK
jgi:putative tryptophan/tyrosine transport system substrate-binding protein